MKYKLLFIVLFFSGIANAQDAKFNQAHAVAQNLNPALTGVQERPRLTYGYKNQWPELSGNYLTNYVAYSQHSKKLHGGFGVNYLRDSKSNIYVSNSLGLSYSYQVRLTRKINLSVGVTSTFSQDQFFSIKLFELENQF